MTAKIVKAPVLGSTVRYIDGKGHAKLALVITTPETYSEGSSLSPLAEGELNLTVFSPSKGVYSRLNVPSFDTVTKKLEEAGLADETPVRFWTV